MNKITHCYMQNDAWSLTTFDKKQVRVGTLTYMDVLAEIRWETLSEDPPSSVVILAPYKEVPERFEAELVKERVDLSRVTYLLDGTLIEKSISVPATEAHQFIVKNLGTGVRTVDEVAYEGVHQEKIKVEKRLHLGTRRNMLALLPQVRFASLLVIINPNEHEGDLKCLPDLLKECPDLDVCIFHRYCEKWGVVVDGGRREDYSYSSLPEDQEEDVIEHLFAKSALTFITAPSYTGKTHFAIQAGLSMITGQPFLGHFAVKERVNVRYFVPELSSGRFKRFMERIAPPEVWKEHEDSFLVRPLDCDLLMLDSAEMIEKCRGYYVFLDTLGYFTGVDNESSYADAIKFATKVNHLIREGCLGVCGLYHPPKYSKSKKETGNILTIENQILGSAGYGGLLRSLLAMRNLHQDSNEGLWCYVQGLKNPGLGKPFQCKGLPLAYLGESLYLNQLLSGDAPYKAACEYFKGDLTQREVAALLEISVGKVNKMHKQWEKEKKDEGAA